METIRALVLIFSGIICVGFMLIIGGVLETEYRGHTSKADRLQCVGGHYLTDQCGCGAPAGDGKRNCGCCTVKGE